MKIVVNGETAEIRSATLIELLDELGYAGAVVATAVNGAMVRAARRAETAIANGDRIEILAPMQGG